MQDYIWIAWDLLAVFFIYWCVHFSAARGFLRTIVSLFSYLIAVAAARILSPTAAGYIYDRFVHGAIVESVEISLGEKIASGRDFVIRFIAGIPELLRPYLPLPDDLIESYASAQTGTLVNDIVSSSVRDPVVTILQSLCFIVMFFIFVFTLHYVAKLFTGVYKIPIIGPINTILGGVMGLLQAALFLLVFAFALEVALFITKDSLFWFNSAVFDDTLIWRVFFGIVLRAV